jgi:hypothetical protein
MQRWMQSAAGGTIQRLKPGGATVLALSSQLVEDIIPPFPRLFVT